jgi:hypothetical protein
MIMKGRGHYTYTHTYLLVRRKRKRSHILPERPPDGLSLLVLAALQ